MSTSRIYKVDAIILKRRNTGEADRILTIFTKEYGKIRIIAKGIRKITSRRAPHLEIFTRVLMVLHRGKGYDNISEVQPQAIYENLRTDLQRASIAYFFCELVDVLTAERQEHTEVFTHLADALLHLNGKNSHDIYQHSKQFTLELLWMLGFLPKSKMLSGDKLQAFIENITERRLRTPHFARRIASQV